MADKVKVRVSGEEKEVEVPAAPSIIKDGADVFPSSLKSKWRADYIDAYKRASEDGSLSESDRKQQALREANRVLRVPEVEDYDDAMALKDFQVASRADVGGTLKVVTIDGKKYSFPVPPVKSSPPSGTAAGS